MCDASAIWQGHTHTVQQSELREQQTGSPAYFGQAATMLHVCLETRKETLNPFSKRLQGLRIPMQASQYNTKRTTTLKTKHCSSKCSYHVACSVDLHKTERPNGLGSASRLPINHPFLLSGGSPLALTIPGQRVHPPLVAHPITDEVLSTSIDHDTHACLQHCGDGRIKVLHPVTKHVKVD